QRFENYANILRGGQSIQMGLIRRKRKQELDLKCCVHNRLANLLREEEIKCLDEFRRYDIPQVNSLGNEVLPYFWNYNSSSKKWSFFSQINGALGLMLSLGVKAVNMKMLLCAIEQFIALENSLTITDRSKMPYKIWKNNLSLILLGVDHVEP
ncbi:hypothetical protein ACJX0J_012845, partial [Zea mays]